MAGAGLVAIKRRMKSIKNTQKITKAMGLVATSKLRKARVTLARAQGYNRRFADIFKDIIDGFEGSSVFARGNSSKKVLYVIFTSESGLCGGFNLAVVNKVKELFKGSKEDNQVLVVGQKGKNYVKRLKYNSIDSSVKIYDLPSINDARDITEHIMDLYITGEVGEVNVVFTRFYSSVKQVVEAEKLLPIEVKKECSITDRIIFEPELERSFDALVKEYIKGHLYFILVNSKASEHASRMSAMDGATKNASDLMDKLAMKYNRIRQSSITQEISEIVGGAEAQK